MIANHQIRMLAGGTMDAGGWRGAQQKVVIEDHRPAGSPDIETRQDTLPDGRQLTVAVVRSGIAEMARAGEFQSFMRQRFGTRTEPPVAEAKLEPTDIVALAHLEPSGSETQQVV